MSNNSFGNLIGTIQGVENFHLPNEISFDVESEGIKEYLGNISSITGEIHSLGELESKLIEEFGAGDILEIDGFRLANAIAFPGSIIRRSVDKIILPNGETPMPTQTNLGHNVVDPIGWSSKPVAPSKGYGLFGKIGKLRPNSEDYNEDLHRQLLLSPIEIIPKGIAFEIGEDENAIMPLFSIYGEKVNKLIQTYSSKKKQGDIPTAKYHGINS